MVVIVVIGRNTDVPVVEIESIVRIEQYSKETWRLVGQHQIDMLTSGVRGSEADFE